MFMAFMHGKNILGLSSLVSYSHAHIEAYLQINVEYSHKLCMMPMDVTLPFILNSSTASFKLNLG